MQGPGHLEDEQDGDESDGKQQGPTTNGLYAGVSLGIATGEGKKRLEDALGDRVSPGDKELM